MTGPTLAPSRESPRFNPARLLTMVDGDRAFLDEFVTLFREDSIRLERELQDAVERHDAGTVERSAHSLRGMLCHLGSSIALDLSSEIESLGSRSDFASLGGKVSELFGEIHLIQRDLDHLRARLA